MAYRDGIHLGRYDPSPERELEEMKKYGDTLGEEIEKRVTYDNFQKERIEKLERQKENCEYKREKLYGKK